MKNLFFSCFLMILLCLHVQPVQAQEKGSSQNFESPEDGSDKWYHKSRYSRTSTHLVVAAGFNNALFKEQSLNELNFKPVGSRFFELGIAWKTRVFERSNWLRFRYGFSFQFNGLKPKDNQYFVQEDNVTQLQRFPVDLDKSKFRMDNLVFPVHFEFGPSTKIESKRSVWFSTHNKIRIAAGGFAGFNLGERQKLKFEEEGEDMKEKDKGDFNTNSFIYGISGYLGLGGASLYLKYDLNPIFDEPNPELHNISIGLRFDVN